MLNSDYKCTSMYRRYSYLRTCYMSVNEFINIRMTSIHSVRTYISERLTDYTIRLGISYYFYYYKKLL